MDNLAKLTNNQAKQYTSLKYKKYRNQHQMFIADGAHLVEEAIKSKWPIEWVIARLDSVDKAQNLPIPKDLLVTAKAAQFDKISPSNTPQGLLAICKTKDRVPEIPQIVKSSKRLIACENISDPGNLGTIIRSAAAFEYGAVILLGNCADIYNPKTVTATQGALFNIPVIDFYSLPTFIELFSEKFELICFSGNYNQKLSLYSKIRKPLLILGGETSGISPELEHAAGHLIKIEQSNKVDSLNVSVAAGIAMYTFRHK